MRARRGISLFEAVAALAIVGITAVSALSAVAAELRAAERARRLLEVESLATERFVFLNLLPDRDFQALPDSVAQGQFDPPLDEYRWTTAVSPNTVYAGLYDVRVTITWPGGDFTASSAQYRRPPVATRGR
jgi:type II secretory pathway pseudopilin PulG